MNTFDKTLVVRMFAKFSSRYGQLWTSRARVEADWEFIIDDWFTELSKFSLGIVRKALDATLSIYKDYPPTLPQFLELCLKASGVPSAHDITRMMVNKDFSHPIVKLVYDKIGSWKLANGTEREIGQKVSECYDPALAEFKKNPAVCWEKLESHKAQLALDAPEPTKIPSAQERKSFAERMEEYKKIAEGEKTSSNDLFIPEFDRNKNNKGGDQYDDYCKYLLSVPHHNAVSLPAAYAYDRQRLLNEQDTAKHLREAGYVPEDQRTNNQKAKVIRGKPTQVYKSWMND